MMGALYKEEGANLRVEVLREPEVLDFIDTHASLLDSTFADTKMSERMRQDLQRSNWVFSGMKTFHELHEAFPSLLDENGKRKPFERFLKDVQRVDKTYNEHYLRAEYNFVTASAQAAADWERYEEEGDRYHLQYRTASDDRVREEHRALHGITLPPSDPFWNTYYPPNGWNCRCRVVQVRKSKNAPTPQSEVQTRVEENERNQRNRKAEMFRFNSGKQRKTVPDYNPYTIRKCSTCPVAQGKGKMSLAKIDSNELCTACSSLRDTQRKQSMNEYLRLSETHIPYYFDENSGGFVVITHQREEKSKVSKQEIAKFEKERRMAKVFAKSGYHIILVDEIPGVGSADVLIDGVSADLKSTGSHNNIIKYAKKATRQQDANMVLFEFTAETDEIHKELEAVKRLGIECMYYFSKNERIHTL